MLKKIMKHFIPWKDMDLKINKQIQRNHSFYEKGMLECANFGQYRFSKKYHCFVSSKAKIGKGIVFPHPTGIVIGEGVVIGDNVVIYQNVTLGRKSRDKAQYPSIGNNVIIYANATVLGDVTIGDNAIIGCNSIVLRDVKAGETVYGVVK